MEYVRVAQVVYELVNLDQTIIASGYDSPIIFISHFVINLTSDDGQFGQTVPSFKLVLDYL